MGSRKLFLILLLACTKLWGWEIKDTLSSPQGDRVILSYDITNDNGYITIKFVDAKKKIGQASQKKYKKLEKIDIIFFDRKGNYPDNTRFSGIDVEVFMIPIGMSYEASQDGYFMLKMCPTISLKLQSSEAEDFSIPMFLSYYERKQRYDIFSRLDDLVVKLPKNKSGDKHDKRIPQSTTNTITEELVEEITTVDEEVNNLIDIVSHLLNNQEEYSFSKELEDNIADLRKKRYQIKDSDVSLKIDELLSACDSKRKKIEYAKQKADSIKIKEEEIRDSIRDANRLKEEKQRIEEARKQNLWLIIGGIILAILGFIGNQVIQHIRNLKSQKKIKEMQANALKQAEKEAKKQSINMASNEQNQLTNNMKNQHRNALKDGIEKNEKGIVIKKISI